METNVSSSPIFDRMSATSGVVIAAFEGEEPPAEDETGDGEQ